MPKFEIRATADVGQATAGLGKLQAELGKTAATAAKSDAAISKAANGIGKTLPAGANQATNALTNLGRVVQDAPFGFIGIANNINPLIESFQQLKVETGSTKGALASLASGLIGAGGLGFAVSVVTSLLTVFSMNAISAGGSAKTLSAGLEPLANKIKDTKKAEDDFKDATLDASTAVLQQTENLLALKNIYTSLAPEIDNVTASVIRQGTAQFLFDKKNTEVQKLLSQEIQREIDLRKKQRPFSGVQEYSSDLFSKDKLTRDIAETKDKIRQINDLSFGLEDAFKNLFSRSAGEKKIRTIADVLGELDKQIEFLNKREILFLSSENKGKLDAFGDALDEDKIRQINDLSFGLEDAFKNLFSRSAGEKKRAKKSG
jgi:ElaB/YqjD/DUF883 family membrane-anchored ribosome-binding protein